MQYIGSLKSLPTLSDICLDYILVKFEQNCMVINIPNFELFKGYLALCGITAEITFYEVTVTPRSRPTFMI